MKPNPPRTAAQRVDDAVAAQARQIGNGHDGTADLYRFGGLDPGPGTVPPAAMPAPWTWPQAATLDELSAARLTPPEIIQGLLWADLLLLAAPGGTGKTTLLLWLAICISTGRPFFGHPILRPGVVLLVSAEDGRELLLARQLRVMRAMALTPREIELCVQRLRISDATTGTLRLATIERDMVVPSVAPYQIVAEAQAQGKDGQPIAVLLDPAISFGVGEGRTNDAEQALVASARVLIHNLQCAVVYATHTGQGPARERNFGQYSNRGGSSFADGARHVWVAHPADAETWRKTLGRDLPPGRSALELAIAKCSFAPPAPQHLFFEREGYALERIEPGRRAQVSAAEHFDARAEQALNYARSLLDGGRMNSVHTLKALLREHMGVSDRDAKAIIDDLTDRGLLIPCRRPDAGERGAREYLHPLRRGESLPETIVTVAAWNAQKSAAMTSGKRRAGDGGV